MQSADVIKQAYRKLLEKKAADSITVTDICKKANVSRRTYYNAFTSKQDVVEGIIYDDFIKPTIAFNELFGLDSLNSSPLLLTEQVYKNIITHKQFYTKMIACATTRNLFVESVINQLEHLGIELLAKTNLSDEECRYIAYSMSATQAMVIQKWIRDGMNVEPAIMAEYFNTWILSSVSQLLT